jgi:oxygen-independent coproporphyrinogen-3 oxidase
MKKKEEMVLSLAKEIRLRKSESDGENVETIYFGEERLAY